MMSWFKMVVYGMCTDRDAAVLVLAGPDAQVSDLGRGALK